MCNRRRAARLARIEKKLDTVITLLERDRRRTALDEVIEHLHRTARAMRERSRIERESYK